MELPSDEIAVNITDYKSKFTEKKRDDNNIIYTCNDCEGEVSTSVTSTSNLKRHLRTQHKIFIPVKKRKTFDTNKEIIDFIIETNNPLRIVEYQSFRRLFHGCPLAENLLKSVETLKSAIEDKFVLFETEVKELFNSLSSIALTADAWSSYSRGYLGICASWISGYKRKCVILKVARIIDTLDYYRIMQELTGTIDKFNIADKVCSITTDNGSNFIKCLRMFGSESTIGDDEDDVDIVEYEVIGENLSDNQTIASSLPMHLRCAAHTLNLSLKAFMKMNKTTHSVFWEQYTLVDSKCHTLWRKQSRSTIAADEIKQICGTLFTTYSETRWKSQVDAYQNVLLKQDKLALVTKKLNISAFTENDIIFLKGFVEILTPLCRVIDKLQGECEYSFLGYLFPIISILIRKFEKLRSLRQNPVLTPVIETTLSDLQTRFHCVLNDKKYKIAACVNPMVLKIDDALNKRFNLEEFALNNLFELRKYCIHGMSRPTPQNSQSSADSLDDVLTNSLAQNRATCDIAAAIIHCRDLESLEKYPCAKKAFISLNTPLTTSATVERAFSRCKQVLTYDRTKLDDHMFEMRTILNAGIR